MTVSSLLKLRRAGARIERTIDARPKRWHWAVGVEASGGPKDRLLEAAEMQISLIKSLQGRVPSGAYAVDPEALRKARAKTPRGEFH